MSVAVLAQGLNKHGWLAQQGQVSDRVVLNYLLFARCVPQVCEGDKTKSSKGATKALPFPPYPLLGALRPQLGSGVDRGWP